MSPEGKVGVGAGHPGILSDYMKSTEAQAWISVPLGWFGGFDFGVCLGFCFCCFVWSFCHFNPHPIPLSSPCQMRKEPSQGFGLARQALYH